MARQKYCICRKTNSDENMVQCDKCSEWFHYRCLRITEVDKNADWFCPICIKAAKQCGNPPCCIEARPNSKYCSDACGEEYNKERYHRLFLPKWEKLMKQHSKVRIAKMDELDRLDAEQGEVIELIGRLKEEREELERNIKTIKEQAKTLGAEANQNKEQQGEDSEDGEGEENITSDQSKSFCPACGVEQTADKYFKHLINCYKKQEGSFVSYLTYPQLKEGCETDENPEIYCSKMVDKKKNWYCPNIAIICPTHANYNISQDEVCGSPLIDAQDTVVPDGNYCLKLKKDCTLHYNWDRFRLAAKDYARLEAFQRLHRIQDEIARMHFSLNETYGGVMGVMLHNTIDHKAPDETEEKDGWNDEIVDMQF
uniref:CXXC-type zinc finger protein 1 n=1 Tax=Aceria tosichella TaxID=561515 RepID=A0A6G1SFG1_9ACAR